MSNINELLTSIILYCIISYILKLPHFYHGLLFTVIGSQISMILPENYRNSLIIYIPIIAFTIVYPIIMIPLAIGFTSSIFISLLSKKGCKLLYPFTITTFTGPQNYLENDTKGDYAATTFLLVLAIIAVIFSMYGTVILNTINENDLSTYLDVDENTSGSGGYVQYININPAECLNKNITTTRTGNTTTTIITEYNSTK